MDRSHLMTEHRLPESMELDRMPIDDALAMINEQDRRCVEAVGRERPAVARAVEIVTAALRAGGRLIYIGAGTSGRLGVLDASECPPTFRTDPSLVQGIIAGGERAMFRSQEGVEDSAEAAIAAVDEKGIGERDVVMGIAAGGTTPFVRAALTRAAELGAKTIFLCCVQRNDGEPNVDVIIRPLVGPEVLTGSTRLKAGTATKLVLNSITTLAMVQLGKVYENLMVDLNASNAKLRDRAIRIVAAVAGVDRDMAGCWLEKAGGQAKLAIVMCRRNLTAEAAQELLNNCGGRLRSALDEK